MQRALDICHAAKSSKREIEGMKGDRQVHAVEKRQAPKQTKPNTTRSTVAVSSHERSQTQATREYCGKKHAPGARRCPAYGKTCAKCGGRNHWASVCKGQARNVHVLETETDEDSEFLVIDTLEIGNLDGLS